MTTRAEHPSKGSMRSTAAPLGGKPPSHRQSEKKSIIITDENNPSLLLHSVQLQPNPARVKSYVWRASKRWIGGKPLPLSSVSLPYIDRFGNNTGMSIAHTQCDAREVIASSIATTARRLKLRALAAPGNAPHEVFQSDNLLQRLAFWITQGNRYLADRVAFLIKQLKKNRRVLWGLLGKSIKTSGADRRFVYYHARSQAKWFNLRAKQPRVKPDSTLCDSWIMSLTDSRPSYSFVETSIWNCCKAITMVSV